MNIRKQVLLDVTHKVITYWNETHPGQGIDDGVIYRYATEAMAVMTDSQVATLARVLDSGEPGTVAWDDECLCIWVVVNDGEYPRAMRSI